MSTRRFGIAALALLIAACATTEFKPFEATVNDFRGKGGTRVVVDGVDFWENGDPPRRFKILGIIDDERPGGAIPMNALKGDIAKKARAVGGDAVVQLSSNSQITGFIAQSSGTANLYGGTAYSSGTTIATPARRNYAKFAVVKYLD